jgi:AcrR family transcriptional regulator
MQGDIGHTVDAYPRGRVPRPVRLAQVVALAEELFVERGFQGASMDELARRADVSKPVIYDLVGSKEQLFHLLMEQAASELADAVAAATAGAADLEGQIRDGGLAFFRFVHDHRPAWFTLLSGDDGPVTDAITTIRNRQARLIGDMIAASTPSADRAVVDALAHAINGAYEALATWWRDQPERPAEELADLAAALLVPGLERLDANG